MHDRASANPLCRANSKQTRPCRRSGNEAEPIGSLVSPISSFTYRRPKRRLGRRPTLTAPREASAGLMTAPVAHGFATAVTLPFVPADRRGALPRRRRHQGCALKPFVAPQRRATAAECGKKTATSDSAAAAARLICG